MNRRIRTLVAVAAFGLAAAAVLSDVSLAASATCSDYATQEEAQRAADTRDGDHDGRYCEALPHGSTDLPPAQSKSVDRVTRVIDGDTIVVGSTTVRLIGIDTPESLKPGTPVECGALAASRFMQRLAAGKRVRLVTDSSQARIDRYGRLLAYAYLMDGRRLQTEVLQAGLAKTYVYGGVPFRYVSQFKRSERRARDAHRGVWATCGGNFHR